MRLSGWSIEGFGGIRDWHVDGLENHDVIVVLGPNESGKSTLRAFIATALYGFSPATREANMHTPADDGAFGGSLSLAASLGERLTVTRSLKATPRARVDRPTGHEDLANRPLPETGAIGRSVYADLHAITIDDLLALGDATWRTVEERLLTGSSLVFLRSAVEARAALEQRATAIWRPDRRGMTTVRALDERVRELQLAEREARAATRRLAAIDDELAVTARRDETLRSTSAATASRRAVHDRLGPASAAIVAVDRARAAADELLLHDTLPADPGGSLVRAREDRARAEQVLAATVADHRRLSVTATTKLDTVVLERATEIEEVTAALTLEDELARRVTQARADVAAALRERARAATIVLGRDADERDVESFERISPAALRAAIAARTATPSASSTRGLARLVAVLALVFGLIAVLDVAGRVMPGAAAAALVAVALLLAGDRGTRANLSVEASVEAALGGLAVAPERRAALDSGIVAEVDALVSAHAAIAVTEERLATETMLAEERQRRRARLLDAIGEPSIAAASRRLEEARSLATAVAGARQNLVVATARCDEARVEHDRLVADERAIVGKLATVDADLERALERIRDARDLRAAAAERERAAIAEHGDLGPVRAAMEAGELDLPSAEELSSLASAEQHQMLALGDLRQARGSLETERRALMAAAGPIDPSGEIAALHEQRSTLTRERDRIAVAAATIGLAERRFREQHGPPFLSAAGRYLARVTDGRYTAVHLAADSGQGGVPRLELVREDGERCRLEPPLSRGTLEQVYLALRLALLDELDGTALLPLYLDEALVNWDDRRTDGLISLLGSLGQRQVIVGTCHPELAERLEAIGAIVVETPARSAPRNPRIGSV